MNHERAISSLPLVLQAPSVLVLSTIPAMLERVAEVLEPRGFAAGETTLTTIRQDAAQARPTVILLDTALYYFDPEAFHAIAAGSAEAQAPTVTESAASIMKVIPRTESDRIVIKHFLRKTPGYNQLEIMPGILENQEV